MRAQLYTTQTLIGKIKVLSSESHAILVLALGCRGQLCMIRSPLRRISVVGLESLDGGAIGLESLDGGVALYDGHALVVARLEGLALNENYLPGRASASIHVATSSSIQPAVAGLV